jgi:hypothetical protein
MTKQRDLKNLVRSRMKKTGESFAAARRHVVAAGAEPDDIERCHHCGQPLGEDRFEHIAACQRDFGPFAPSDSRFWRTNGIKVLLLETEAAQEAFIINLGKERGLSPEAAAGRMAEELKVFIENLEALRTDSGQ